MFFKPDGHCSSSTDCEKQGSAVLPLLMFPFTVALYHTLDVPSGCQMSLYAMWCGLKGAITAHTHCTGTSTSYFIFMGQQIIILQSCFTDSEDVAHYRLLEM